LLLLGKEYKWMSHVRRISSSIMKRAIKQWWSTISPVSTKRTTSPHFKSHAHTHMTIRLLWVVACLLWVVRQEFPFKFIIFSFPCANQNHRHSYFLICSLPRLWYRSLSGSIYLSTIYPYFTTFRVTTLSFY
jgi:hypothetical protein